VDGAIGVGRHAPRVRELAESRAVRPHREDLLPERVRADGIAARREQDRPADPIGRRAERPDSAAWGAGYATQPVRLPIPRKVRELTELVAPCADGEELADLTRVLAGDVPLAVEMRVSGGSGDVPMRPPCPWPCGRARGWRAASSR
jgi:hypothetical protein